MSDLQLNRDLDMIERMEKDLTDKVVEAFSSEGVEGGIYGVFSLDHLEGLTEQDLCRKIAVGVQYTGVELYSGVKAPLNTAPGGNSAVTLDLKFLIVLGVPTGPDCQERFSATKLLTLLRRDILGSTVSGDRTNRTWAFVKEAPNVDVSSDTMLYYSQAWRVSVVSNQPY